jgi:hypothetical protein
VRHNVEMALIPQLAEDVERTPPVVTKRKDGNCSRDYGPHVARSNSPVYAGTETVLLALGRLGHWRPEAKENEPTGVWRTHTARWITARVF